MGLVRVRSVIFALIPDAYPLPCAGHVVKFYCTKFEISKHFQNDESPSVLGTIGRFGALELSKTVPYNTMHSFIVDLWTLGRTYETVFLEAFQDAS